MRPRIADQPFPPCLDGTCSRLSRTKKVRGYCGTHAERLRKAGLAGGPRRERHVGPPMYRLLMRAELTLGPLPSPCLRVRTGQKDGRIQMNEGRGYRLAYEHWNGPIPAGFTIDHLCCDPWCIAGDHLEAVTNAENVRRDHERARLGAALWLNARSSYA